MTPLAAIAVELLPQVFALIRRKQAMERPSDAEPTDDEVKVALKIAVESSIAKDDAWLAAHPE